MYFVNAEFLAELRNCEPAKKDKETESKKKERDEAEKKSKEEEAGKVRKEVNLMGKRYLEQKKNTEKEKSDKSDKGKEDVVMKKKAKKRVAIEKVDLTLIVEE